MPTAFCSFVAQFLYKKIITKMPRRVLSAGTMTGLLIGIAGVALLTVYVVLVVRQHNDLASPSSSDGPEKRRHPNAMTLEISTDQHGDLVGKSGPVAFSHVPASMTGQKAPPPPIDKTAQCNGPNAPNCTRQDMWNRCFIPLADLHPKDGYLTRDEVAAFMDKHLRFYERWAAPSADKISADCDKKKGGNGRVNWAIFRDSTSPGCLGSVRDICLAKGVCDRELEKLGLPPVVALPTAAHTVTIAASRRQETKKRV